MAQVLDAAYPAWTPASLKAAGVPGVCRYLSWLPNSKVIDKAEYDALLAAGLTVTLNWESSGTSWRYGYAQGVSEGREARRQARELGHPDERPIIQSIDEDLPPELLQVALAYQRGFNDGGGCGPQGAYTTGYALDAMAAQALIRVGWQTNARGWYGNGPDSAHAALLQRTTKSHPIFPPNSYDESDVVRQDFGQHPAPGAPAPAPAPVPPPKPPKPIDGGKIVDLTKTKTAVIELAPQGFGLFYAAWETHATVAACWATTHGPQPSPPVGPDDWWPQSIEGQVRVQQRGTEVIVTGFYPNWKPNQAHPQVHVFAIPT
jgi:hypothetical protein